MTKKQLNQLKNDVLNCLTDKNVARVPTKNNDEEFGALMALGQAFVNINKIFDKVKA